jgi:hypothetical protein
VISDTVGTDSASADIYGNVIYGNTWALYTSGAWTNGTFKIYNNSIYQTGFIAAYLNATAGSWSFRNNVIKTDALPLIKFSTATAMNNFTPSNNIIYYSGAGTSDWMEINSPVTYYTKADVAAWNTNGYTTNPNFTGGTLPTGFTGTYQTDLRPNTDYFSIASGNAIGNGATLGYPYNGCINQAGYLYPGLRPAGSYDIGAYQNPSALLSTVPTLLGGTCQGCILTQ